MKDEARKVRPSDSCRGLAGEEQCQGSAPRSGDGSRCSDHPGSCAHLDHSADLYLRRRSRPPRRPDQARQAARRLAMRLRCGQTWWSTAVALSAAVRPKSGQRCSVPRQIRPSVKCQAIVDSVTLSMRTNGSVVVRGRARKSGSLWVQRPLLATVRRADAHALLKITAEIATIGVYYLQRTRLCPKPAGLAGGVYFPAGTRAPTRTSATPRTSQDELVIDIPTPGLAPSPVSAPASCPSGVRRLASGGCRG